MVTHVAAFNTTPSLHTTEGTTLQGTQHIHVSKPASAKQQTVVFVAANIQVVGLEQMLHAKIVNASSKQKSKVKPLSNVVSVSKSWVADLKPKLAKRTTKNKAEPKTTIKHTPFNGHTPLNGVSLRNGVAAITITNVRKLRQHAATIYMVKRGLALVPNHYYIALNLQDNTTLYYYHNTYTSYKYSNLLYARPPPMCLA